MHSPTRITKPGLQLSLRFNGVIKVLISKCNFSLNNQKVNG